MNTETVEERAPLSHEIEARLRDAGESVTVAEVIKAALPFHRPCRGKGWTGSKEKPVMCECAVRRFLARNGASVVQVGPGEYAWRKKAA